MPAVHATDQRRSAPHLTHLLLSAALALVALALAAWVVLGARFGPVVWALDSEHGLHTGDATALPLLAIAAHALVRLRRRQRDPMSVRHLARASAS